MLSLWLWHLSLGLCSLLLGPERETPSTKAGVGSRCTELYRAERREPGSCGTGPAQLAAGSDHMGYSPSRPAPGSPGALSRPSTGWKPRALQRGACAVPRTCLLISQAGWGRLGGQDGKSQHTTWSSTTPPLPSEEGPASAHILRERFFSLNTHSNSSRRQCHS